MGMKMISEGFAAFIRGIELPAIISDYFTEGTQATDSNPHPEAINSRLKDNIAPASNVFDESAEPATVVSLKPQTESATRRLNWSELIEVPEIEVIRHSLQVSSHTGAAVDWANPELKHVVEQVKVRLLPKSFTNGTTKALHAIYKCEMEKCCMAKFMIDPATVSAARLNEEAQRRAVVSKLVAEFSSKLSMWWFG
ncbi:unnamed protein product [Phytophthora lilii]|uniref:Unnamed protein product n=1 Tax=Phytophthora lilii TaxID=2077276 RepID=A0A9W6WFB1_9STRA|nr:unnamed protein product [Phytophthora lilii]